MNVEIGTAAAQFLFCEYINSNFFAVCVIDPSGPKILTVTDSGGTSSKLAATLIHAGANLVAAVLLTPVVNNDSNDCLHLKLSME
jgi:hypothetical protein